MENYFIEHIKDLSRKSENRNCYVFSDFLSQDEISTIKTLKNELSPMSFNGGAKGTERQMLRFGSKEDLMYEEDFPIACIEASPVNIKFSDTLTHRDFLGALMNLSIERNQIGDIVVKDNKAFIFVTEKISPFICENLHKVKHTNIKCDITNFNGNEVIYELKDETIISSSLRADCIISSVYNLSRKISSEMFRSEKVYINSVICANPSKILTPGDKVSLRGFGKFIFCEEYGRTKKDRIKIKIKIYV